MDPAEYKLIHYLGIFFLLAGLGGLVFAEASTIKHAAILHGIGLILLLLGGFGMAKHEAIGFPWWFWVKAVIWLVLAGMINVAKKKLLPPMVTILIVIALAGIAAYLGFANSVILRIG